MSNETTLDLQLIDSTVTAHAPITAAALDGEGPYDKDGSKYYRIGVSAAPHHRVTKKGAVSPYAGNGYNRTMSVTGMSEAQLTKFLESNPTIKVETYTVDAATNEATLAATEELEGVKLVTGSVYGSKMAVDAQGNTILPTAYCTFSYTGGTYGETGGDQYVLQPAQGTGF